MFTYSLNPVLFHLGPLQIRWYGIIFLLGFIITYFWLQQERKQGRLALSSDDISDLLFYLFLGVLIGARFFAVFIWEPAYYFSHPGKILAVWEGGLAFHGGLIGAALAGWLFARKKNIPLAQLADTLTLPAVLGLALGRIANFINGELWGTVTTVPWCANVPGIEGCRHPAQIYYALKRFLVLGILLLIARKAHKPGFLFWNMITLFGIGRFFIDFFKDDPIIGLLTMGQYLSILMAVAGCIALFRYYRTDVLQLFARQS
ncbi:prolipoprotein diacylglyceryl transferase [Candidatus Woesearchaeota archaeon]|nr:prolipoprotein diacylglyceryl transferase [Candidatus Woesearchaeota archaeon]